MHSILIQCIPLQSIALFTIGLRRRGLVGAGLCCAITADTGLPQELAKQMSEVTRQIAGLTNELESLLPRARYIRDRPTNAPPAGCSDDDENWRSQGDEIASKSLATGHCFPTNLVILPGGSTVDENRNRAGA